MNNTDKINLINKIKEIEGLTDEEKSSLLGLLRKNKTYGLVWEDKPEAVEERLRDELPILTEVPERAIISDDKDAPNHILIEGDNLEALTTLAYTHAGKIDVIYIDPPYNTGKADEFKYNDKYVDAEDSYRHSKWLSFMYKRLLIAKKLLSPTGVLFCSIDDYSQSILKNLLDEIFEYSNNPKYSNFIATLIWNKQHSQQQGLFKKYHEYVLVYAKKRSNLQNVLTECTGVIEAGAMKKISIKNPASEFTFPAGTKVEAPDYTMFSGTYGDSEKVTVVKGDFIVKDCKTINEVTLSAGWTQKKQMQKWFSGNETFDTKGQKIIEFYFNSKGKIKCRKERVAMTPCTILPLYGMGSEQTEHLDNILGYKGAFSNPKPVEMIKNFISWFCPKEGFMLDFFAGSGSTLESTMQLNVEDGGHRQCILVTNNENNICEDVTYERNKRVINGYTTPKGEEVPGLTNNNLRYYRTDFVSRKRTNANMRKLVNLATDMLCIKEDLYIEKHEFGGEKTYKNIYRYFDDGKKQMLIIYREEAIDKLVELIAEMEFDNPLLIYVFSPSEDPWQGSFEDVEDKVKLCALPMAIYNTYKRILPKKRDSQFGTEKTDKEEEDFTEGLFGIDNEGGEA